MPTGYDVIIVGLGAMGSAATYHLAKAGKRVLGLDRFKPPHTLGSSHGLTRIIREAYFEHPLYVPLVQRSYELWAELEAASGRPLFLQTGGLRLGSPDGQLITGARRSAEQHKLPHQILSASELRGRFPAFRPAEEIVAVWEPRAGILFPELAVDAHLKLAVGNSATLRFDEPVLKWEPQPNGVRVFTATGIYQGQTLLLSAGAWMSSLEPGLNLPLTVERQVLCWFEPALRRELFQPRYCPIYICEYEPRHFFYGFPDLGDGIKAALHHQGEITTPDSVRREAGASEVTAVRDLLVRFLPGSDGALKSTAVCLYTNTPDEHFVLGRHPNHPQVLIASPCSGHGFKFSPVIGEIAAMLLSGQTPPFDLSLFAPDRFAGVR
ncbi:MAG TPA: N-methyl-L-tryptophan oxidase [Candidatus Binatia bacterium]|jgi:sarcosine oxidase|nr:N-methyl-L-tryptophan oxidase [Candidatus Binatia bacterium]